MAEPSEHEKILSEIRSLRSQVRKSHQQFEPFVEALAEMLDGCLTMPSTRTHYLLVALTTNAPVTAAVIHLNNKDYT